MLLTGSSFSGMSICPVTEARELFVFLPGFTGGSGGGSPLFVADEFFELLSELFERLVTFRGISSFASEADDESDDTDLDLKRNSRFYRFHYYQMDDGYSPTLKN